MVKKKEKEKASTLPDIEAWQNYVGCEVVIDTSSSFLYIGRLSSVDEWFVTLEGVDVHDRAEGPSTKERYIMETRKGGIRANRKHVAVRKSMIVSFSRLDDVVVY